jgi:hypothetical protein
MSPDWKLLDTTIWAPLMFWVAPDVAAGSKTIAGVLVEVLFVACTLTHGKFASTTVTVWVAVVVTPLWTMVHVTVVLPMGYDDKALLVKV